MPANKTEISIMLEAAREAWYKDTVQQVSVIYSTLKEASDELGLAIARASRGGKIPENRLRYLLKQVEYEMRRVRPVLSKTVKQLQKKSIDDALSTMILVSGKAKPNAKVGIGTSFIGKDGKVYKYNPAVEAFRDSVWFKINTEALESITAFTHGGLPLSKRVWDITWTAEKSIKNRLHTGVLLGHSSRTIARDIKQFLILKKTPSSKALANFHPGSGVYKSAFKNAFRLASTEINRAYVEGIYAYQKEKPWITGYIWRTASGNPCPECSDHDGQFYPKSDPPQIPAHPHCFCYPEIQYSGE